MATITVPSDPTLPVAGAEIKAAPLKDWITNIRTFLEATNIDEANVDTSGTDGIVGKSIAQTITGLKTFSNTSAAAGGLREVAKFEINPSSGTPANNDGLRMTFTADDAGGSATAIGYVDLKMTDASASSEDSEWRFSTIANASSVTPLVVNSTAITMTTSTVAIGTNATVGGSLTVTGGGTFGSLTVGSAAISEAELEMLDGITPGTILASKAVVVDSNKDASSFRNVTLTGELDAATLDISGNADIDGTTNLDAVDIDGAVQIDSTVTVGVDDQGYDVKFFGDTASAYLLWDTSADKLLTAGGATIDIVKDKLLIGGTAVTTTAAELNVLDAVSAGTVTASLAVVVDSNKDIGSFRNITLTGELDAGSLDVSGDADIDGTLEADAITLGGTALGSLYSPIAGSSSIVTVGTVGTGAWQGDVIASAYLDSDTAHLSGTQTFTGNKTFTGTITVGVDGTGKDVTFFGDTSGSKVVWDESADDLVFTNAGIAVGSDATGDIYYRNSSGFLTRLAAGADGTVLTGTGAGAVPAWESPASGDITSVVAGVGLSGGGASGDVTLTLDISELSTVTPADGDFFATLDSDGANEQKTTTTALATLFAGAGMTASSSVLNVIGGDGITANSNDVAITAAQTTVTSVLNASLAVGRDADNQIKFGTDDQIVFEVAGGDGVTFKASGEIEATTLDISGDADIDGTLEADAITLGGTALGSLYSPIAGSSSIVTTGALNSGSITSGFGTINNGSSTITTTGALSAGATTVTSLNASDGNITNVGNIALDTISSDAGTTVSVTLGTDAGDDFIVGNNNALVVEGDNDHVGVGVLAPAATMHVRTSEVSGYSPTTSGDDFVVEGNTNTGISIASPNNLSGFVNFGSPSGNENGNIRYYHSAASPANAMAFATAATERMLLDSGGSLHVTSTNQITNSWYNNQTTDYISIQVAESQNNVAGLAFGVGANPTTATSSNYHHAWIQGIVTNSSGPLTGDMAFFTNGGDNNVERMRIDSTGAITAPSQPSFLAQGATQSNVTGDGTEYTITFAAAEVFDRNADFSSPTFTAPVTGIYQFGFDIALRGITSSHTSSQMKLVTSNRTYQWSIDLASVVDVGGGGAYDHSHAMLADMDASDTCTLTITVGNGSKVVDVEAATSQTWFYGYLVA